MAIDEIDQKQLKQTRDAFLRLSQTRFNRMESSLSPMQADYLKLIPLLFHVNHPMLPGYVDSFTPCGLPNYTPTPVEKSIAKTVSQSFVYKSRAHLSYKISSLFLMGSMGTLGQSNSSDIDLWVCLAEPLEEKLQTKLENKAEKIKLWFATVGIELNYYFVNQDDFSGNRAKKLETDSCGSTQKFLLLDEFYRTAVWVAGRWPIWWVVPTEQDYVQYSKRLIEQKHLDSADWIDFGEVKQIPAAEYFSAALWQLYKAIESPYKSSVKLLVLEVYAKNFPCSGILSSELKENVYQSSDVEQELDPYLLMLRFAEKALVNNPRRLEFLRRAFYLKANVKITMAKKKKPHWRYIKIKQLVDGWGWNEERLNYLNSRLQWSINRVTEERKDLVRELTSSYHFLSNFARVQGVIDKLAKNELMLLGRKLYAAFERRNGKIDKVNNGIAKNIIESEVTIHQASNENWHLYLGHIRLNQTALNLPVYSSQSLFECLVWGCVNGVILNATRCHVLPVGEYLNHQFVGEMVRDINKLLGHFSKQKNKESFDKEAKTIYLGVFINTRRDPLAEDKQENLFRIVENANCLSWADNKINLAEHFDILFLNSWGEITVEHYSENTAWIDFFIKHQKSILNIKEDIPIFCRGLSQKDEVIDRVNQLINKWKKLLLSSCRSTQSNGYIIAIGKQWMNIDFNYEQVTFESYNSMTKLYDGLSKRNDKVIESRIRFHIDPLLQLEPIIQAVMKRRPTESLEFYVYQKTTSLVQIVIKSSNGLIHFQVHKNINIDQVVGHYQQFFDKIQNRNLLNNGLLESIDYFQCFNATSEALRIKPLDINDSNLYQQFSLVQAIAVSSSSTKIGFDLFTSDASFYYREGGEAVYSKLANQLLSMRQSGANYPIFLTDIDLSAIHQKVSIIEALGYKKMIEKKLNRVL